MKDKHLALTLKALQQLHLKWVPERTIFLARHGSWCYGTNIETSDLDVRGVAVPPKEYYFGYLNTFEQTIQQNDDVDLCIFDIQKFIKLCADGNPNALEILFTDPSDHLIVTKQGEMLLENKEIFLSKKLKHTLSGYAFSQLERIKSHRKFLLEPCIVKPNREDFGLIPNLSKTDKQKFEIANSIIKKRVDEWNLDFEPLNEADRLEVTAKIASTLAEMQLTSDVQFSSSARSIGFDDHFVHLLEKEREYNAAIKRWEQYNHWLKTRNEGRAALEAQFGFDTKHGMHLVRLVTGCEQVLETGKYVVKRPDRDFLLSIRNGSMTYEQLMEFSEEKMKRCAELYETSKLPKEPNRKGIEALTIRLIESMM